MQKQIFNLIGELTGQNNLIVCNKLFKKLCGDYNSALMLSQLLYWYNKTDSEWIYKTHHDWKDELELSIQEARTAQGKLVKLNLIETSIKRINNLNKTHYKINENELYNQIYNILNVQKQQSELLGTTIGNVENNNSTITDITNIEYEQDNPPSEFKNKYNKVKKTFLKIYKNNFQLMNIKLYTEPNEFFEFKESYKRATMDKRLNEFTDDEIIKRAINYLKSKAEPYKTKSFKQFIKHIHKWTKPHDEWNKTNEKKDIYAGLKEY